MNGHFASKGDVSASTVNEPGAADEAIPVFTTTAEDEKREKKLIQKMDIHILPFMVLLYLFSFLDRGTQLAHPPGQGTDIHSQ